MNEVTEKRKLADEVARWERFCDVHRGVFPPRLAAQHLDLTVQGVHSAANRGHIAFIEVGRERFYSRKDVCNYKWSPARRGKHAIWKPPYPSNHGKSAREIRAIRLARQSTDWAEGLRH